MLPCLAREVAATELGPLIENWFADGLLDPMVTDSLEWIQTDLNEPFATHQAHMIACDKGYVRNDPCPCGSGKKFKKCCGA